MGSTPIGGPIAGAVAETFGGRAGLILGAAARLAAAALGALVVRRSTADDRAAAQADDTYVPAPAEPATEPITP
jgi:hypothetical protein